LQIAVVGDDNDAGLIELTQVARRTAPGGTVIIAGRPDADGVPLLASRPLVSESAAAYVCRGYVCDRPSVSAHELQLALT